MKATRWMASGWCVICFLVMLGSCAQPKLQVERRVLSVGMILGSGGLGDRSFNDAAYAGLQEAQRQFGTRFQVISRTTEQLDLQELRNLADQGFDLIIGIGFENASYIETLAQTYPQHEFAIVDSIVEGENVASIVFREQEGDFLMGVLAAMLTQSGKVGFIGGMDIPPIRRIESGFRQGVAYQSREIEVVSALVGSFDDVEKGKALALAQYETGVDLIYNGAGRAGLGIIDAAVEADKLVLGTSGDQRYLAPGHVVGNRPKRLDTVVLMLLEELEKGQFTAGTRALGLREDGLSMGPFDETLVTPAMLKRLRQLEAQIVSGDIVVVDGSQ